MALTIDSVQCVDGSKWPIKSENNCNTYTVSKQQYTCTDVTCPLKFTECTCNNIYAPSQIVLFSLPYASTYTPCLKRGHHKMQPITNTPANKNIEKQKGFRSTKKKTRTANRTRFTKLSTEDIWSIHKPIMVLF
jgi:hypothetical protein